MTSTTDEPRFLKVAEVATILRVSRPHVYQLIHDEVIPVVRLGDTLRIPRRWLDQQLEITE